MTKELLDEFESIGFGNQARIQGTKRVELLGWIDKNFVSNEDFDSREIMIRAQERASAEQDMTFYKVRVLEAIGEDQEPAEDGWVITLGVQNAERNKLRSELKQKLGLV